MKALQQPLQLASDLHLVYHENPHRNSGNVYAITSQDGVVLIDCGSEASFPQLQQNLQQIGKRISDVDLIIATHGDFDHTQGLHQFVAHGSNTKMLINKHDWLPSIEGDNILTKAYVYSQEYKPLPADRCIPLNGNQLIGVGDHRLMFLHTPGHSQGSSCLLGEFDDEVWLFAGDTVGGALIKCSLIGTEACFEYFDQWKVSLDQLSQLKFDWVVTGHDTYPISRKEFDLKLAMFGQMLNPWFFLDDEREATQSLSVKAWSHRPSIDELKAVAD